MAEVCLKMLVEKALEELFHLAGLDFLDEFKTIVEAWKTENELQQLDALSLYVYEDHAQHPHHTVVLLYVKVHLPHMLETLAAGLENRLLFDLVVRYHQASRGRRCYVRDLAFEILRNQLT